MPTSMITDISCRIRESGADGLVDGEGCGCGLDDLAPCGDPSRIRHCRLARKTTPPEGEDLGEDWYVPMDDEEGEGR